MTPTVLIPCHHIENFPMTVGKKVILQAISYWRGAGTEKWIQDEEARYICPECGNKVFRGVVKCNHVKRNWIWTSFFRRDKSNFINNRITTA